MSIIRIHKQKNFSIISNLPLNDPNLSMKARGIWATLLSKPDDWTVYVSQLVKTCKDGKASIYSGLKELKDAGYLEHIFIRDDGGKMVRGEYIVHEEPIEVKPPTNTESEPYTENRNTVNQNTENPPLLKTKDKLKTDDDKQTPVPPPTNPTPVTQEPKKKSSSSFSEENIVIQLAGLMTMIPEDYQIPEVEQVIKRSLTAHTEEYIRLAISYTIFFANHGIPQKFKAYLGKCIDNGWAIGWDKEKAKGNPVDQEATRKKFKQMPDETLKMLAGAGNQFAIDELALREK